MTGNLGGITSFIIEGYLIVKTCLKLTHESLGSKALKHIRAPSPWLSWAREMHVTSWWCTGVHLQGRQGAESSHCPVIGTCQPNPNSDGVLDVGMWAGRAKVNQFQCFLCKNSKDFVKSHLWRQNTSLSHFANHIYHARVEAARETH